MINLTPPDFSTGSSAKTTGVRLVKSRASTQKMEINARLLERRRLFFLAVVCFKQDAPPSKGFSKANLQRDIRLLLYMYEYNSPNDSRVILSLSG